MRRDAAPIWDIAALHVEPLSGSVRRIEPDRDADSRRARKGSGLGNVEKGAGNAAAPVIRVYIQIADLRDTKLGEGKVRRTPAQRDEPGNGVAATRDPEEPFAASLLAEIRFKKARRLAPAHGRKRRVEEDTVPSNEQRHLERVSAHEQPL